MEVILKNNEEENIPHMNIINKNFQSFSRRRYNMYIPAIPAPTITASKKPSDFSVRLDASFALLFVIS